MISSLISLWNRDAQQRELLKSLETRKKSATEQIDSLTDEITTRIKWLFLMQNLQKYLRAQTSTSSNPPLNLDEMSESSNFVGSVTEDNRIFAEWVLDTVKKAWEQVSNKYPTDSSIPTQWQLLANEGFESSDVFEQIIFENVARWMMYPRESGDYEHFKFKLSGITEGTSERRKAIHDRKLQDRSECKYELKKVVDEINVLKIQNVADDLPSTLHSVFASLGYFGVVGILIPLYFLTNNPAHATSAQRTTLFWLFISGFILLLAIIGNSLRKYGNRSQ